MTTMAPENVVDVTAEPYGVFRSRLLSPDQVRRLSALRPWRAVIDTAGCWLCILLAWGAVAVWPSWWVVLAAMPVIGNRYYALFIIGHDGMHRRVFNSLRANDLFCDLSIFGPVGAITRVNNRNHLKHHRNLAKPDDPDRHKHGCFNKADRGELLSYLVGLTSSWRTLKNTFVVREADGAGRSSGPRYTGRDLAILIGWQAALIGGLTWAVGWWAYPVLWVLPVYVFWYLADAFRSFAEHSHPESDAKADAHRLITYLPHALERALVAPMNMNHHTVHHLWPSIPYYHLPKADEAIRTAGRDMGLEWRRSYLGYLVRYWLALPLAECRESAAQRPPPPAQGVRRASTP